MVAHLQGGYRGADPGDGAGGFVAEDHGVLEDEAADGAVGPVVDLGEVVRLGEEGEEEGKKEGGRGGETHIAAADAGPIDSDEDVVVGLEVGDGAVFEFNFVGRFKDEGEILMGRGKGAL